MYMHDATVEKQKQLCRSEVIFQLTINNLKNKINKMFLQCIKIFGFNTHVLIGDTVNKQTRSIAIFLLHYSLPILH